MSAVQTGSANSSFSILLMVLIGKIVNMGYTGLKLHLKALLINIIIIILPVGTLQALRTDELWVSVIRYPTFLELLQHGVQLGVVEDKVQRVVVELGDGRHGGAVVRVHQSQVLHVEDLHDVGPGESNMR